PNGSGVERLDRVGEVIRRTRERRQVQNSIDAPGDGQRSAHIGFHELETRIAFKVCNIPVTPGTQIVDRKDRVALGEQAVAQMRTGETCAAGNHIAQGCGSSEDVVSSLLSLISRYPRGRSRRSRTGACYAVHGDL